QNVYFTAFASPNEWAGTGQAPPFFQDYQTNFGTQSTPIGLSSIDTGVMLSYDAMLVLFYSSQQVLSQQSTISPSDLTQALKQVTGKNAIQGVTGRIAFDSNGDQDEHKMILVEHIGGHKLVIEEKHGCLRITDNCGS